MKKLIFACTLVLMAASLQAQVSSTRENSLTAFLSSYYNIKNALVEDKAQAASESAKAFIQNINGISYQVISEGNVNTLLKDAGFIADAKNIETQRKAFANFSINVIAVVKALQLNVQPAYVQYCPMEKAYWLSNSKVIENPYYGKNMLHCGEVVETIP